MKLSDLTEQDLVSLAQNEIRMILRELDLNGHREDIYERV